MQALNRRRYLRVVLSTATLQPSEANRPAALACNQTAKPRTAELSRQDAIS
jgi:hypothetical protein